MALTFAPPDGRIGDGAPFSGAPRIFLNG